MVQEAQAQQADPTVAAIVEIPCPEVPPEVLTERIRTLDQIKRVYAVMMGAAATLCASNIAAAIRNADYAGEVIVTTSAQGLCFASLLVLFFVGTERYLDKKYLRAASKTPKWYTLMADIICLMVSGVWFVVLAQSVLGAARDILQFNYNLLVLYGLDFAVLLFQLVTTDSTMPENATSDECKKAYRIWIVLNVICFVLVSILTFLVMPNLLTAYGETLGLALGALILAAIHIARFLFDFSRTFRLYYPCL